MSTDKKDFDMFGAVAWAGDMNGKPAVITAYRNGVSAWIFNKPFLRAGYWVRHEFTSVDEAMLYTTGAKCDPHR